MNVKKLIISVFLMLSVVSCSGYRVLNKQNPFAQYGIRSICIPNFYNHSNLANVASLFQREIYMELARYKKLTIKKCSGNVDGVLVGIVKSGKFIGDTIKATTKGNSKFLDDSRLALRKDFNVATVSDVILTVDFILIRHPKAFDQKLFKLGELSKIPESHILFSQSVVVQESFNREIFTDDESVINNVQNRGSVKKKVAEMATSVRRSFRDLVLYAF